MAEATAVAKYNKNNAAVKRILSEVKEMQSSPSNDFMSLPLEEDIFEWQFAILGPKDSEFEGGIYHGRIILPAEYPFKPPSFMMLTPSGRFETNTKICLSISSYHPEHWQPSWSVRTALVALIAFMPTNPNGAVGSLDYKKEDRRTLAIKSREGPPKCGSLERQRLIDEIHQYLLGKAPPIPPLSPGAGSPPTESASEIVDTHPAEQEDNNSPDANPIPELELDQEPAGVVEELHEVRVDAAAGRIRVGFSAGVAITRAAAGPIATHPKDDRLYTWAAFGLTLAIFFLLAKKILKSNGFVASDLF